MDDLVMEVVDRIVALRPKMTAPVAGVPLPMDGAERQAVADAVAEAIAQAVVTVLEGIGVVKRTGPLSTESVIHCAHDERVKQALAAYQAKRRSA